jgi:hypothetical protein
MKSTKLTILVLLLAGGAWARTEKVLDGFTRGSDGATQYATGVVALASQHDAQGTFVSSVIEIANHGGWGLIANIGADKGDKITLDVRCDHDKSGWCLTGAPTLQDGTKFELVSNTIRHQKWQLIVPKLGDQIINANYWWVGIDVHYEIRIVAIEKLQESKLNKNLRSH